MKARMNLSSFESHQNSNLWEKKAQVNIHLPVALIKIAERACKREFRSKSSFFAKIIFDHFSDEEIEKFQKEIDQESQDVEKKTSS